jgi:hypothetical protein
MRIQRGFEVCFYSLRKWVFSATPRPLYPRKKATVPFLHEAAWAGLESCEKKRTVCSYQGSKPEPFSPSLVLYQLLYSDLSSARRQWRSYVFCRLERVIKRVAVNENYEL